MAPSVTATLDSTFGRDSAFDRLDNDGLINVDRGTLSVGPTWSLNNSGTVRVTAGGALALSTGSLTGTGTIELQSGASATFGATNAATFSIAPAALLDVRSSATASFAGTSLGSGRLMNSGTISVAGKLTVNSRWSAENAGTVRVNAGTAQLDGSLSNTGSIVVTSGSLQITANQVTNAGRIDLGAGAVMTVAPLTTGPTLAFQNAAGGVLNVGPSASASFAGSSSVTLSNAGEIVVDHAPLALGNRWAFSNTGKVTVNAGTFKFYSAADFTSYTNTGSIDLRGGAGLVVARPTSFFTDQAQTLQKIHDQIVSGYDASAWDGAGIRSASAAVDPTTAVGYAPATASGSFLGTPVAAGDVLVRHTKLGDATLDGTVNFSDLLVLARAYNSTGAHWYQGDFDYNGVVNFNDLLIVARNYNATLPAAGAIPGAPVSFDADMAAALAAAVPEPSGALAVGSLVLALAGRRRREPKRSRRTTPR